MSPRDRHADLLGTPGKALAAVQDRVLSDMATGRGLAAVDASRALEAGTASWSSRFFGGEFSPPVWWALKQSAAVEIERTSRFGPVLEAAVGSEATRQLAEDTRYLIAAFEDVGRDVDRTLREERALAADEIDWLLIRQNIQALSLLVLVNDSLDIGIRLGAVRKQVELRHSLKKARATRLRAELRALKAALEETLETLENEAQKAILNTSITVLTRILPPVGLVARGATELGQAVANWALSDRPETLDDVDETATARKAVQRFSDEIAQMKDASGKAQVAAKGTSHATTLVGFVFDVQAVLGAHRQAEQLTVAIERARHELDAALTDLEQARPIIQGLERALQRWEVELERQGLDVSATRRRLDSLRQEHGYFPSP